MWRRRRRTALLLVLLVAALIGADRAVGLSPPTWHLSVAGVNGRPDTAPPTEVNRGALSPTARAPGVDVAPEIAVTPLPAASNRPVPRHTPPVAGTATFGYARTAGPVLGRTGDLRRFQVAVEQGVGQDAETFAAAVDRILGDPRSWIAAGDVRFQRLPEPAETEFTIYLATETTSERMCATGGLTTERFTSCRLPGQVIINLSRWLGAIPGYGSLAVYQAYAVNHEVGHELGLGHEACPGPGRPAPVMQQQTYGLKGCTANAWPYLDGRRYVGEPVP